MLVGGTPSCPVEERGCLVDSDEHVLAVNSISKVDVKLVIVLRRSPRSTERESKA